MRVIRCVLATWIILVYGGYMSIAMDGNWEKVSRGIPCEENITYVQSRQGSGTVFVGTGTGVYISEDAGENWRRENLTGAKANVTGIAVGGGKVYVSSDQGLYVSEGAGEWDLIAGKKKLKGVLVIEEEIPLVWTGRDIYLLGDEGYLRAGPGAMAREIVDVAQDKGIIYAATKDSVIYSLDKGRSWDKYIVVRGLEDEIEIDSEEVPEVYPVNSSLYAQEGSGVVLASGKGVYLIDVLKEHGEKIDTSGLPASSVVFAAKTGKKLFAATGKKVFLRKDDGPWQAVFENAAGGEIKRLAFLTDNNGRVWVWVVSGKGIFRRDIKSFSKDVHLGVVRGLSSTPGIREVQAMAVEYAEVNPDKIRRWRQQAQWEAILPRVSLGFSESLDDNIEIYKSSSKAYTIIGPRERNNDWGIDLTWDLSELIWNDAQTSIDTRSRLMVQLRDDILEEVTRLYFERKRLITEIGDDEVRTEKIHSKLSEKLIRIEELTAYIDAYTGGEFSEALARKQ